MACYPCTHCNKCGMYSIQAQIVCAECGAPFIAGVAECPECGCTKTRQEIISVDVPRFAKSE